MLLMRLEWPTVLVKASLKYLMWYFSIENYIFIEIKMLYGCISHATDIDKTVKNYLFFSLSVFDDGVTVTFPEGNASF